MGSLAAALRESAERHGLDLDVITAASGGPTSALVAKADRVPTVQMGSQERWFIIQLRGTGVCLSMGSSPDLDVTTGVLQSKRLRLDQCCAVCFRS